MGKRASKHIQPEQLLFIYLLCVSLLNIFMWTISGSKPWQREVLVAMTSAVGHKLKGVKGQRKKSETKNAKKCTVLKQDFRELPACLSVNLHCPC